MIATAIGADCRNLRLHKMQQVLFTSLKVASPKWEAWPTVLPFQDEG